MGKLSFRCVHYRSPAYRGATVFVITAFGSRHWQYKTAIGGLLNAGFNVYIYDYAAKPLLGALPRQWIEFSDSLAEDIAGNIKDELARDPGARFGVMGSSVGSTLGLHAAKKIPELESMIFVTLYGSSAQLVWENGTLKKMKKHFLDNNKTMFDAVKEFAPMEGVTDLEKLGRRPILLYASMDDKTIRFSNTNLFIQSAIEHNLNFSYTVLGMTNHTFAIIHIFRNQNYWLPFFSELLDSGRPEKKGRRKNIIYRSNTTRVQYV